MTGSAKRTLLGNESSVAGRQRVYETDDGIIVESTEQYELSRKSVLFEDVVLVTYHREIGWTYVLVISAIAFLFFGVAGISYASAAPLAVVATIAGIAAVVLIPVVLRIIMKVDVVSVFGRRSRAAVHFPFRKQRARELYGRICHLTRQAQKIPDEISQTQSVE